MDENNYGITKSGWVLFLFCAILSLIWSLFAAPALIQLIWKLVVIKLLGIATFELAYGFAFLAQYIIYFICFYILIKKEG